MHQYFGLPPPFVKSSSLYWRGMHKIIPGDLPALWRERAETLRSFGDPACARLWDIAAVELERAQALFAAETLSLTEAARVSGYTPDHLGSLIKRGKILCQLQRSLGGGS